MSTDKEWDAQRVTEHYSRLATEYGVSYRAVDWGSAASQHLRFAVFCEMADLSTRRVLDVGCGVGEFLAYCRSRNLVVDYTGWDLTPEMVALARARFPDVDFNEANAADTQLPGQWDYVVASGIFAFLGNDPYVELERMLRALFARATKGLMFNLLSAWGGEPVPGEFVADPVRVLTLCKQITPRVALRHDYLPHDVSFLLRPIETRESQ